MKMNEDDPIGQKIKQTLDRQVVSDEARNALRNARVTALADDARQPSWPWKPVAFASLLLFFGAVLVFDVSNEAEFPAADIEDLAVISSEDELEFFEELEFYIWIEEDQKV
jgi:hypothetical protein